MYICMNSGSIREERPKQGRGGALAWLEESRNQLKGHNIKQ